MKHVRIALWNNRAHSFRLTFASLFLLSFLISDFYRKSFRQMIFFILGPKLFKVFFREYFRALKISKLNFDIIQSMLIPFDCNFRTLISLHGSNIRTGINCFDIVCFDLNYWIFTLNRICAELLFVTVTVCVICYALYSIVSEEKSSIG